MTSTQTKQKYLVEAGAVFEFERIAQQIKHMCDIFDRSAEESAAGAVLQHKEDKLDHLIGEETRKRGERAKRKKLLRKKEKAKQKRKEKESKERKRKKKEKEKRNRN